MLSCTLVIVNDEYLLYHFTMSENIWREKWSTTQIMDLLLEQFQTFWQKDAGLPRAQLAAVERVMAAPHDVIVSGLRRVGKSTLLAQVSYQAHLCCATLSQAQRAISSNICFAKMIQHANRYLERYRSFFWRLLCRSPMGAKPGQTV